MKYEITVDLEYQFQPGEILHIYKHGVKRFTWKLIKNDELVGKSILAHYDIDNCYKDALKFYNDKMQVKAC